MKFLRVAAVLAAMMSESDAGGGGSGGSLEQELARLREENARLRADQPPPDTDVDTDVERARREQDLRGPGQADAARRVREEGEARRGQKPERKRLTGDESTRELARFIHQNAVFQGPTSQAELDRLRISMGDEQHETHVAIRDYHRALANDRGHPNTPAGNVALQKEIDEARKAVEDNPRAKKRLEKIETQRRRNEPVDLTEED